MTPQEAAIRLREWYQAFKNFGKGNERTVHEFLEAADLIESLAAELDTFQQFTKELGARNEELQKEKLTLSLRVKQLEAERDELIEAIKEWSPLGVFPLPCKVCKNVKEAFCGEKCKWCRENSNFEWRGLQKEATP